MSDISIILRTSEYRGDHSADVAIALRYLPGETVEELVARAAFRGVSDVIEIRTICTGGRSDE